MVKRANEFFLRFSESEAQHSYKLCAYKKIPQSGNMQHPICGTETNDIFEGNCIFFGGGREKNWGGRGWGKEI